MKLKLALIIALSFFVLGATSADRAKSVETLVSTALSSGAREMLSVWRDVTDGELLSSVGKASYPFLSSKNVRVVTWNAHKGDDPTWTEDLKWLSAEADLLLLQEAVLDVASGWPFTLIDGKDWKMANSFFVSPVQTTGVATGSSAQPIRTHALRSPDREPFTHTPKMALVNTYPMDRNGCVLLVANMHGINFTPTSDFQRQLEELAQYMAQHTGPMILAGDFNTWNVARLSELLLVTHRLGMNPLLPAGDFRLIPLDHLFVRGFDKKSSALMSAVTSSDHYPLFFELELNSTCGLTTTATLNKAQRR